MNDERFLGLAMKAAAGQHTDAERAELDALLAKRPELKAEFARLQAEARLARETLPLVAATEATAGEFPAYARARLQTKVRQAYGRVEAKELAEAKPNWLWLRWLTFAGAAVAVAILLIPKLLQQDRPASVVQQVKPTSSAPAIAESPLPLQPAPTPTIPVTPLPIPPVAPPIPKPTVPPIQFAMIDLAGLTRGAQTNETAVFQQVWSGSVVKVFANTRDLGEWEKAWPEAGVGGFAKIIYDRAAAEVRVIGHRDGTPFEKVFAVERDLAPALAQAKAFLEEQLRRQ